MAHTCCCLALCTGLMFPSAKTAASKSYKLVCARLVRAPSSDVSVIRGQLSDTV